jgi:hypothetical protein
LGLDCCTCLLGCWTRLLGCCCRSSTGCRLFLQAPLHNLQCILVGRLHRLRCSEHAGKELLLPLLNIAWQLAQWDHGSTCRQAGRQAGNIIHELMEDIKLNIKRPQIALMAIPTCQHRLFCLLCCCC